MDKPSQETPPPVSPPEDRLDSWKEIGAYLNRDVTTVQRWEKREGMPVHRHLHDRMGSVYASRAELDAWARGRVPAPPARANPDMLPSAAEIPGDSQGLNGAESARLPATTTGAVNGGEPRGMRWSVIGAFAAMVVALGSGSYFYFHKTPELTDKDTIIIADFTNKTGDTVFDDTLRQGLSVQLEQSPFLSLVSDQRIRQTLRLMGQPADTKLTAEISREVCQRTGSKAVIDARLLRSARNTA